MKVLLREDVQGVGRRGDIVDVSGGFARNHLLPSGKALKASDSMETQAASMRRARDLRDAKDRDAAQAQAKVLAGAIIGIPSRAAAGGRLFGSVGPAEITKAIEEQKGVVIDAHQILLDEHIKEVGTNDLSIQLFDDVVVALQVEVIAQG